MTVIIGDFQHSSIEHPNVVAARAGASQSERLDAAHRIIADQTALIALQHAALCGLVHQIERAPFSEAVRNACFAMAQAQGHKT